MYKALTLDHNLSRMFQMYPHVPEGLSVCDDCSVADIQEFYEITLLNDQKTSHQKTIETLQIASKWEGSPPITNSAPLAEVGHALLALIGHLL